jgi:phenylalanyl-tRNA synthetase alpha chain
MHEVGGSGSLGYRYSWAIEEAKKNILRTHTTAVTTRTLFELAQTEAVPKPLKFFSIDRVFRNEALDATHLAEFHQIEGCIIGLRPDARRPDRHHRGSSSSASACTTCQVQAGVQSVHRAVDGDLRLPPDSAQVGRDRQQRHVRPEMLLPMGLPPNYRVIAWGFGPRAPDYDPLRNQEHSRPQRPQARPLVRALESGLPY